MPAPSTGTTILACLYKDGVVVGADGRVSVGNYISNRSSNKITPLCDNVYLLRSGSAPDTQIICDYVRYFVDQLVAESGELPSVQLVAKLVAKINYENKDNLVGAMVVAGYDNEKGGQVFGAPIGGTLSQEKWAVDGSGSTYIWGLLDEDFREDMTREEAEHFVISGLALAMARDCSSGGCVRLVTMNKDGAFERYIPGDQVPLFLGEITPPARVGQDQGLGMMVD